MYISDECPKGKGRVLIDIYDEEDVREGRRAPDDKRPRCSYHRRHQCSHDECVYHPLHGDAQSK